MKKFLLLAAFIFFLPSLCFGKASSTNPAMNDSNNTSGVIYKLYTNGRYGFSIEYPSTFAVKVIPDNDDGRIFSSPDGEAELTVSGINNVLGETAQSCYQQELKEHPNAAYKVQRGNWLIVSWVEGLISRQK